MKGYRLGSSVASKSVDFSKYGMVFLYTGKSAKGSHFYLSKIYKKSQVKFYIKDSSNQNKGKNTPSQNLKQT